MIRICRPRLLPALLAAALVSTVPAARAAGGGPPAIDPDRLAGLKVRSIVLHRQGGE